MIFPSYTSSARTFAIPGALQIPFGIQKRQKQDAVSKEVFQVVMRRVVVSIIFRDKE